MLYFIALYCTVLYGGILFYILFGINYTRYECHISHTILIPLPSSRYSKKTRRSTSAAADFRFPHVSYRHASLMVNFGKPVPGSEQRNDAPFFDQAKKKPKNDGFNSYPERLYF